MAHSKNVFRLANFTALYAVLKSSQSGSGSGAPCGVGSKDGDLSVAPVLALAGVDGCRESHDLTLQATVVPT